MMAYLTADEAKDRLLGRYYIEAKLADGDMEAASSELDALAPFIGNKYDSAQTRQFPRSVEPDGSTATGTVPDAILDAVSLLALGYVEDWGPPVQAEGAGGVSVTYISAKRPVNRRRFDTLVTPYLRTRGRSPGPTSSASDL